MADIVICVLAAAIATGTVHAPPESMEMALVPATPDIPAPIVQSPRHTQIPHLHQR